MIRLDRQRATAMDAGLREVDPGLMGFPTNIDVLVHQPAEFQERVAAGSLREHVKGVAGALHAREHFGAFLFAKGHFTPSSERHSRHVAFAWDSFTLALSVAAARRRR